LDKKTNIQNKLLRRSGIQGTYEQSVNSPLVKMKIQRKSFTHYSNNTNIAKNAKNTKSYLIKKT